MISDPIGVYIYI